MLQKLALEEQAAVTRMVEKHAQEMLALIAKKVTHSRALHCYYIVLVPEMALGEFYTAKKTVHVVCCFRINVLVSLTKLP